MILCPSCGTENGDGMRFCVKCGAALTGAAPSAGSWQQPSGNLYDTPSGGTPDTGQPGGYQPGSYMPPSVPPSYGYPQGMNPPGGMNYALWGDRVLAALIDGALVFAVVFVLNLIFGTVITGLSAVGGEDNPLGGGLCCVAMILIPIAMLVIGLYNKVYLLTTRGASIGQGLMKLKVIDANGQLLQTGSAVVRLLVQMGFSFIPFLGIFLVLLDLLFPLWDPQRQTLHDKAVGSFVVKTEG